MTDSIYNWEVSLGLRKVNQAAAYEEPVCHPVQRTLAHTLSKLLLEHPNLPVVIWCGDSGWEPDDSDPQFSTELVVEVEEMYPYLNGPGYSNFPNNYTHEDPVDVIVIRGTI